MAFAVSYAPPGFCQGNAAGNSANRAQEKLIVKLVHERKKSSLEAISRKSATMIVWDTDQPVLTFRIPSSGRADSQSEGENRLVQVEIPSGKEIASLPSGFSPTVRYFPSESKIVFKDSSTPGPFHVQIGVFGGETTKCLESRPAIEIGGITPVSEEEAIGLREHGRVHTFVRLQTSDCTVIEEVPADPAHPEMLFGGEARYQPALSVNNKSAAYIVRHPMRGPEFLILRGLNSERTVKRIRAPEGWFFQGVRFTPDSRLLVAAAWQRSNGPLQPEARHGLFVYSVDSGQLVRTLAIDGRDGLAFSPDGLLLAAGSSEREDLPFGGERVKAIAVLYDFASGQEVARVEHPWFKWRRGMWGMLTGLEFSADGQFLVTSTHDILVWRIGAPVNK